MPYAEARKAFTHPIACIDCHAPDTMALRVTRPGFLEGIRALKASEGVKDYDVSTMATRQEMRGFVCGQCHVEYYFKGPEKRLTYPWAKAAGATGPPLTAALEFQRHGQFYVDFVESENSNGFHAPQETARILGEAIDYLRQGQLALRPASVPAPPSARRP